MRAPDPISTVDPPSRWFLDDQSNQNVSVKIAAGAPEGASVLLMEKAYADQDAWRTQLWVPRLELQDTPDTGHRSGSRPTVHRLSNSIWARGPRRFTIAAYPRPCR